MCILFTLWNSLYLTVSMKENKVIYNDHYSIQNSIHLLVCYIIVGKIGVGKIFFKMKKVSYALKDCIL